MKPAGSIEVENITQQIENSESSVSSSQPSPQAPAQPTNSPQPHTQVTAKPSTYMSPVLGVYRNIVRSRDAYKVEVLFFCVFLIIFSLMD